MFSFILFFLIGSIPFGWIIYKLTEKRDIRKEGSGNIGAANIYRLKGKFYGILVLFLDALKGVIAIIIAKSLFESQLFMALSALTVVSGHIFSPFLSFKGGKGVATSLGSLAVLSPKVFLITIIPVILILFLSRIVSLASLTFAFLYPFLFVFLGNSLYTSLPVFSISLIVFIRHKENILRLIKGNERRIAI